MTLEQRLRRLEQADPGGWKLTQADLDKAERRVRAVRLERTGNAELPPSVLERLRILREQTP